MLPSPALSEGGALDYGIDPQGDDTYTLRFDGAPQYALPVSSSAADDGDNYLIVARLAVEALARVHLKNWPNGEDPELDFPLFCLWAMASDGSSVLLNTRPPGAPPIPTARW